MSIPLAEKQFATKPNRYMPKTKVRLDKLVATQQKVDRGIVRDLVRKSPEDFDSDPVVSSLHKGSYLVGDGHKRVAAAIERGDTHMTVRRVK